MDKAIATDFFKKGMIVVNPRYIPEYDNHPNVEQAWMLCIIDDIVPHRQRKRLVAYKLRTIKSGFYISSVSLDDLLESNRFLI
jgi:hypothetical protein